MDDFGREGCEPVRSEAEQLWSACTVALRGSVSDAMWNSCFAPSWAVDMHEDEMIVAVPSSLVKERIESRFFGLITKTLAEIGAGDVDLVLEVQPGPGQGGDADPGAPTRPVTSWQEEPRALHPDGPEAASPQERPRPERGRVDTNRGHADTRHVMPLNPRYTFDAFVTGASNRFAQAAALSVAETPARAYNPLFIYGVAGLGKTHLLHAVAHYVKQMYPELRVRYVSTEAFMNDFVDAIRTGTTTPFKRRYRQSDVLLVDDIQFMEGKEGLQEEFFHTFNELHGSNSQIVLSSDRPPRSIATLEDRLRSRFEWGLITDIQPPDLETRLAILRKKAEREQSHIPDDVLEFIASHIKNNIRELEGALIRVSAFASLNRAPLDAQLAADVLRDVLTDAEPRVITARVILDATAAMFSFSVDELCGVSRRRPLVEARQIGMYVCRELTDLSYPAIAREYGGRDHTTVIHAVEKIGNLMREKRQVYNQVTDLMATIRGGG